MLLEGRTVLVTGGASGLGGATAEMVVAAGGRVVIVDLKDEIGQSHAQRLGQAHARFVRGDVTAEADVQRAIDTAVEAFAGLHGVVNAAGIAVAERVLPKEGVQPLAHFARVIEINLIGTFNVIRLASVAMSANAPNEAGERGVIVNTASVAAFDGQIGQAAYSASKGGIVGMTLPIARDLARDLIRVNSILPGVFDTPLLRGLPDPVRGALEASVPNPSRLGNPDEYASLALEMIRNAYFNGECVRLDGAIRMGMR